MTVCVAAKSGEEHLQNAIKYASSTVRDRNETSDEKNKENSP